MSYDRIEHKRLNYRPKESGKFSQTETYVNGELWHRSYRPRVIGYEGTWNVLADRRQSVPFLRWEDAARFAVCAFEYPEVMRSIP